MAKLYPPGLAGSLPAFTDINNVTIPITQNKTVRYVENRKLNALIKTVQTNKVIGVVEGNMINSENAKFNFSEFKKRLKIGNFYKIQIAYIDNNDVGYYSTVGVIKYTAAPVVKIQQLDEKQLNDRYNEFTGVYINDKDPTEKVYSYRFDIFNQNGELIETSEEQVHNHYHDVSEKETIDFYKLITTLSKDAIYYIQYSIKTINDLYASSPKYPLGLLNTVDLDANLILSTQYDEENAYINLFIESAGTKDSVNGKFIISRASSKDNYKSWYEITRFVMNSESPTKQLVFKDFTIEHGYTYKYALQQYNKHGFYTNRKIIQDSVTAKFEHIYLFDGERQLKIKFNPKVSSLKKTILETKIDTIGSKYPYIFRNGAVDYREFPLSGLISYHSDDQQLFMGDKDIFIMEYNDYTKGKDRLNTPAEIAIYPNRSINLNDKNISAERIFRDKVYNFLTDGKPKLFKSPVEGNIIIKLMNSSLSPTDTLGRMLHTFSATAYEIDDYDYQNLINYGFIKIIDPTYNVWRWKSIDTVDIKRYMEMSSVSSDSYVTLSFNDPVSYISIVDAAPGTMYKIGDTEIMIGVTGQYHIDLGENTVEDFSVIPTYHSGIVTFRYTEDAFDSFNKKRSIFRMDINKIRHFIGKHYISEEINTCGQYIEDCKYLKFEKRPEITLYIRENLEWNVEAIQEIENLKFYIDPDCEKEFQNEFEPYYIYKIVKNDNNNYYGYKKIEKILFYIDVSQVGLIFPKVGYEYEEIKNINDLMDGIDYYYRPNNGNLQVEDLDEGSISNTAMLNWIKLNSKEEAKRYVLNPLYQVAYQKPVKIIRIESEGQTDLNLKDYGEKYKNYYKKTEAYTDGINSFEHNGKIYISPEEYNNNILIVQSDNEQYEILNVTHSLTYEVKDFLQSITNIEIGWGVSAVCIFDEKIYEYEFDSYTLESYQDWRNKVTQDFINNQSVNYREALNKYTEEFVKYQNSLLDVIESYEAGLEEGGNENESIT